MISSKIKKQNTTLSKQFQNRNIVETAAKSILLTHKYMATHPPGLVQAIQSEKDERVKLVSWVLLNERMQLCQCFAHVSKMPIIT